MNSKNKKLLLMKSNYFDALRQCIYFICLFIGGIMVVFILINIVLLGFYNIKDSFGNPVVNKYGNIFREVYPEMANKEISALLRETWSRSHVFEPFTQFKERAYTGKYIHVSENGFRLIKNQGPWPPSPVNLNIFVFGGSTTFGYGVADDETVPSYLQKILTQINPDKKVRVYNFGRAAYYSIQERILLERLITDGFIPNMAIFIDGLNDFFSINNEPNYTKEFKELMESPKSRFMLLAEQIIYDLPLGKLLTRNFNYRISHILGLESKEESFYNNEALLDGVIKRYLINKRMIELLGRDYHISLAFIWQPVPTYHYDLHYDIIGDTNFGRNNFSKYGYPRMAKLMSQTSMGDNFLWCADIQLKVKEPLYVDQIHYSAKTAKLFAQEIVRLLQVHQLLTGFVHSERFTTPAKTR